MLVFFVWALLANYIWFCQSLCLNGGRPAVRKSVFTGAKNQKFVKISGKCCTLSCNCRGIREARCFLNTVVAFKSKFNSTLHFLTPNLDVA